MKQASQAVKQAAHLLRVRTVVFSTGERFPCLIEPMGFPATLPTRFTVDVLAGQKSSNTTRTKLIAIRDLYEWADALHVPLDLDARLRSGSLLELKEIISFCQFVRAGGRTNVVPFTNAPVDRTAASGIKPNTEFNTKVRNAREFVRWVVETQAVEKHETRSVDALVRRFDAQLLPEPKAVKKYGLPKEIVDGIVKVLDPDSRENPFNRPVRHRNRLIFGILHDCGVRRSELCNLRLEDIVSDAHSTMICVVRRKDDKDDPRRNQPQVKTENRRIPIRKDLHRLLIDYLRHHRGRHKHPFLIVAPDTGAPLNPDAINKVLGAIKVSLPDPKPHLTPHILRHTFASRVWDVARKSCQTDHQADEVQNYLCGWVEGSQQGAAYSRSAIEQAAVEAVTKMHAAMEDVPY